MEELFRSLPKLLRASNNAPEVEEVFVMAAWKRIAGEGLRGNAVPFRLYRKTLVIAVADISWQKQLEPLSGQMLFRLNSTLGQPLVTYLEFRVDPKTVEAERARLRSRKAQQDEQEKRAMEQAMSGTLLSAAQQIRDETLRRRFLVAAGSCLERRKQESAADDSQDAD
jgi:hypothetical protein